MGRGGIAIGYIDTQRHTQRFKLDCHSNTITIVHIILPNRENRTDFKRYFIVRMHSANLFQHHLNLLWL